MKIINIDSASKVEVDIEGVDSVFKQLPIGTADGSPSFSFRVFTINPSGHTPFHVHLFEHVNYIIEGVGCLVTENGKERILRKGDFVLVLPNEKHQYKNRSNSESMIMICAVPKDYE